MAVSPYFTLKRVLDVVATLMIIVLLSPIWLLVAVVALLDVGSPILAWQPRWDRVADPSCSRRSGR